jgi:hypothetical protein
LEVKVGIDLVLLKQFVEHNLLLLEFLADVLIVGDDGGERT